MSTTGFGLRGFCAECARWVGVVAGDKGWVLRRHKDPFDDEKCSGSGKPAEDVR